MTNNSIGTRSVPRTVVGMEREHELAEHKVNKLYVVGAHDCTAVAPCAGGGENNNTWYHRPALLRYVRPDITTLLRSSFARSSGTFPVGSPLSSPPSFWFRPCTKPDCCSLVVDSPGKSIQLRPKMCKPIFDDQRVLAAETFFRSGRRPVVSIDSLRQRCPQ